MMKYERFIRKNENYNILMIVKKILKVKYIEVW